MNNKALLASVALNVFLVAFVLGRMSVLPAAMPAPMMKMDFRNGAPPPPMFGPQELFGEDDMKKNFKEVQVHFEKIQGLRQEFAQTLMKGKVTEEQAAQHLKAIDAEMEGVKNSVQVKAAQKIASMPDEKRIAFAKHLMEKMPPPPMVHESGNGPTGFGGPPPDFRGPPPDRAPPPQPGQIPGDFDLGTPPQ